MKKKLDFEALGDLSGGSLKLAMDIALQTCLQDLHNRPALDKSRRVTLSLDIVPQIDKQAGTGALTDAEVDFKIETKIPGVSHTTTRCRLGKDGMLYFDVDIPEDPNGPSIMDEEERLRQEKLEIARAHQKAQEDADKRLKIG